VGIEISKDEQTCLVCGRLCKNRSSLCNHLSKSHKDIGGPKNYVIKYLLHGKVPKCKCGCGNEVSWHKSQYHFNDYVNGHNDAGFKSKSYKETPENTQKRIEAIKNRYENDDELKQRISNSVTEAFKDPVKKSNLVTAQLNSWDNAERKAQQSISQKQAWTVDHEARVAKVFTPEWGLKIAAANMSRDKTITSNLEKRLFEELLTTFPDMQPSRWYTTNEKISCADAYIHQLDAYVEFDGVYWHGFDRQFGYTFGQIKSITNDLRKNIAIITKKLTVVRLVTHDNTSMCNVRSFQDLAKMAYYVILDGEVVKDKLPIKKLNVNEYSNENVKIEINKLNFEHERYQLLIK